jgi:hypothetical protein
MLMRRFEDLSDAYYAAPAHHFRRLYELWLESPRHVEPHPQPVARE